MAFDVFKKKELWGASGRSDALQRKKKSVERALVTGTFLFNTGCSISELSFGQRAERLATGMSAQMSYDFVENKTVDDLENIKKTKEFQRINDALRQQGLSVDPLDLAAVFVHVKKDGSWRPMIKLSAWRSGTYVTGVHNSLKKIDEYGMSIQEFGDAVIAKNELLSKMTGLTVVASLEKTASTMMSIQAVTTLGGAFQAGESAHDDHIGDVVDSKGKYIEIFLRNTFKDIPGGFSGLIPESKREILVGLLIHEELHLLAFPGHIPGQGRSLMNAEFPFGKVEEILYQGKKQYRAVRRPDLSSLEQDPASIICRGGLFPLFKEDIMKERIKGTKK